MFSISATLQVPSDFLFRNLEKILQKVYESPVAKTRNITVNLC
jgi:hypothetical protein